RRAGHPRLPGGVLAAPHRGRPVRYGAPGARERTTPVTYLRSLPADTALLGVFKSYPQTARPLLDYHELVMRGPSPFTVAARELIAAYVSGVNACNYCHGVHTATAEAFGVPPGLLAAALADLDAAPVDERLRPVLRYVGKLTSTPSRMAQEDA